MTELTNLASRMATANDYTDVFGVLKGTDEELSAHIRQLYRRLARVLHPDSYNIEAEKHIAQQAFQRLNELHRDAQQAVAQQRYGQKLVLATVRTKRAKHEILHSFGHGDLCATFTVRSSGPAEQATFGKIARLPADKDLLQTEATVLKRLRGKDVNQQWVGFIPDLVDAFVYAEAGKPRRQANIVKLLDGFYNLQQLKQAFPEGLEPVHLVWIWRRLLVAIGHAHDNGIVHGAVLPGHVMVNPELHGLVLVDWCYASIRADDTYPAIKAIVSGYKSWYPTDVLQKQAPGPGTDLTMAARCMIELAGGDPVLGTLPATVPRPLRAFMRGCLQTSLAARPDDAWRLLGEFDELLKEMGRPYYPRPFRPFTMPANCIV